MRKETTLPTRYKPGAPRGAAKYQELYDAINNLYERDRVLVHQIYWDGLSLRRISRDAEIDHAALVRRHKRILRDLRTQLAGSSLNVQRVHSSDGTWWSKCGACRKWVEYPRQCSCGNGLTSVMNQTFENGRYFLSSVTNPTKGEHSEMSDAELLAQAQADAERWQRGLAERRER